ncbi:putative N-acetyltransferase 8B [Sorex araneus]|uniref:putative N-acetyltransferase 8B n=1 Tax=Sorex araneus TaxID=42254 RepID=UPI0024337466|nr:putative N-acetyltransferase 8B [Sorex araneus]XP_054977769.1 putative N-acetyltransferase 8B [Sorex araneus]
MASYHIRKFQERDGQGVRELFSKAMGDNISPTFYHCLKLPRNLLFLTGVLLITLLVTGSRLLTLLAGLAFLAALRFLAQHVWSQYITFTLNTTLSDISKHYMSGRGSCFWVAESQGRVVGTVGALPVRGPALSREHLELFRLCVDSAHRGQGIAKALVRTVFQFGQDHGYKAVVLSTSSVQYAALGLYQRLGFRRIHEFPHATFWTLIQLTVIKFIYHLPSTQGSKGPRLEDP